MRVIFALSLAAAAAADSISLTKFDGGSTEKRWIEENDPVMGGESFNCTFRVDKKAQSAGFTGEVKIVPALKAPGFCFARTNTLSPDDFPDVSGFKYLQLVVRNNGPLSSFKVAFAADTVSPQFKCFKADVDVPTSTEFTTIDVPFDSFSNDWDPATGEPKSKSPPSATNLKDLAQLQIWAEGKAGKFDIEIKEILASNDEATVCKSTEYCCPDAKHCLTPTLTSCAADASVCKDPQVCCPLTKVCVDVGAPCTTPCKDQGTYCCPDALHCLTPVNPGKFCADESNCNKDEVCCPLTKLCVSVGDACTPP